MRKKEQALELLLSGSTVKQASLGAACSERQIYRWLRDPKFTAPIRAHDKATGLRLAAFESQALDALLDVMSSPEQSGAGVKRLAARDVLELRLKWLISDLEERLTAIERKIDEKTIVRNYR